MDMEENISQEWENIAEQPFSDIPCPLMPVDVISTINEGDIVIEAETFEGEDTVIVLFDHDAPNNKYDVNIIEIGEQPLFKNDIPDTPFVITDEGYMDFIVSGPEPPTSQVEAIPSIHNFNELESTIDPIEAVSSVHDEYEPEPTIIDLVEAIHEEPKLESTTNLGVVKSVHDEPEPKPIANLVEGLPSVPDKYELDMWNRTSCPHCHKTFKNPSSVVAHMIVHNGGKPFICEMCGKRSKREAEHAKHIDKHNQPTLPIIKICCEHCEIVFYRKRDFRKHYIGFHGIHRCRDCGQLFNRHTELVKHGRYNIKVAERAPCLKHTKNTFGSV